MVSRSLPLCCPPPRPPPPPPPEQGFFRSAILLVTLPFRDLSSRLYSNHATCGLHLSAGPSPSSVIATHYPDLLDPAFGQISALSFSSSACFAHSVTPTDHQSRRLLPDCSFCHKSYRADLMRSKPHCSCDRTNKPPAVVLTIRLLYQYHKYHQSSR